MEKYERPEMKIIRIEPTDIITISGCRDTDTEPQ